MQTRPTPLQGFLAVIVCAGLLALPITTLAQVVTAPPTPQIGSSNTISADPAVKRPHGKPCKVQLFTNQPFADFNTKTFVYTPPADCPGPWTKVIFTADFTVTAGRQFDRTAQFFLGGVNLYFGTTAEPRAALSPSWHVERDVTDLTTLFRSSQPGTAILGNFVGVSGGVTYDGIIYANAQLEFYPADFLEQGPRTADMVIGMPGNSGAATLSTPNDQLSQNLTLPMNVEAVYLDVIAQSQSNDEFWYLCVPSDLASALQSCGGTSFRETEITVDGRPAGVAPVYPWIYTGGIDPFLWEPIPGVQTLNFKPYRVDLTPFAGVLSDGKVHTLAISVFNANGYFSVTGNLLLYLDHAATKVSGSVLSDNLSAQPLPEVVENVIVDSAGNASGPVTVTSTRNYSISGYVDTSHGRVETTVSQRIRFSNTQTFSINTTTYVQDLEQSTTIDSQTTTRRGALVTEERKTLSYPLEVKYNQMTNADGSLSAQTVVDQKYLENEFNRVAGLEVLSVRTANHVSSQDTLSFSAAGVRTGHTGNSSQIYVTRDSRGSCYSRALTSVDSVLTAYKDGAACHPDWQ
jgi:hypothetical protein